MVGVEIEPDFASAGGDKEDGFLVGRSIRLQIAIEPAILETGFATRPSRSKPRIVPVRTSTAFAYGARELTLAPCLRIAAAIQRASSGLRTKTTMRLPRRSVSPASATASLKSALLTSFVFTGSTSFNRFFALNRSLTVSSFRSESSSLNVPPPEGSPFVADMRIARIALWLDF